MESLSGIETIHFSGRLMWRRGTSNPMESLSGIETLLIFISPGLQALPIQWNPYQGLKPLTHVPPWHSIASNPMESLSGIETWRNTASQRSGRLPIQWNPYQGLKLDDVDEVNQTQSFQSNGIPIRDWNLHFPTLEAEIKLPIQWNPYQGLKLIFHGEHLCRIWWLPIQWNPYQGLKLLAATEGTPMRL